MDLLNNAFGIHERALGVRSQRMEVLARNIANADTPNYKAEELDFKAMLKETQREYIAATHEKHYAALEEQPDNGMRYRVPFNSSFDGNTVEINTTFLGVVAYRLTFLIASITAACPKSRGSMCELGTEPS